MSRQSAPTASPIRNPMLLFLGRCRGSVRPTNAPSRLRRRSTMLIAASIALLLAPTALGQGGYNDSRVMIQGFMWESHQSGEHFAEGGEKYNVDWQEKWYDHVKSKVDILADAKFDLIWLPPPSQGEGAGYHPQKLNDFDNNYGSEDQHRQLIHALLGKGIEPIADVVINHRNGSKGWAIFENPAWPSRYICSTDEFWFQDANHVTEEDRKILARGEKGAPDFAGSNFPNWHGARDLDHTNSELREEIKKYLKKLKEFGYRGWRYDMVKGFGPGYVAEYNYDSTPSFAVGEYWDANPYVLTQWVDGTKLYGQPDPGLKACAAFDFATYELLRDFINSGKFNHLPAVHFKDGVFDGFISINKDKAVTFLENHDTGWPQKKFDSFPNDERLLQGYAYLLTHPGVPCVYWKHYFEWNRGDEIKALIRARKYAGVTSGSYIQSRAEGENYIATIGDKPTESSTLIVKIGPDAGNGPPDAGAWALETSGKKYAVWVRKAKKAETQAAVDSAKAPFPVPGG